MSIITALKCGATPELEAEKFIKELFARSFLEDQLSLPPTVDFINELFKAIDLQTQITVQQLEAGGEGVDWLAAGCRTYIFHYNAIFFNALQRFLIAIFECVLKQNMWHDETDELTPVHLLMDLLTLWCNVYANLMRQEPEVQVQYFEEPLARINFYLFCGAHTVRKTYYLRYHLLNDICKRLFHSAMKGLYYIQCHLLIADNLLTLVEQDFGVCPEFADDAQQFIIEAFTVMTQKTTYCNVFKCLKRMLDRYTAEPNSFAYKKLVAFLIETPMQEICYTTLKFEKTKRLLTATLDFLNTLQSNLLDLDCFAQSFIEEILAHTMNPDESIARAAAELYIKMAQRKLIADDFLLKHIIEFYYMRMASIKLIPAYVASLWPCFSYIQSMQIFHNILVDEKMSEELLSITGHFMVAVYTEMMKRFEKFGTDIIFILEKLPALLKHLKCYAAKGAVLMLLNFTDFDLLRNSCNSAKTLLEQFEDYVTSEFKHGKNLQYPYVLNLFMRFMFCIEETKNFHKLEECGVYVYMQYEDIERVLTQHDQTAKQPKAAQLRRYCDIIQKLNVLLKPCFNVLDSQKRLLDTLSKRLIGKKQLTEFAKSVPFLDAYAIELVVSSCIKLSADADITTNQKQFLATQVQHLADYLLDLLCNINVSTHVQLVRLKSMFNSLVNLYYVFNNASNIYHLKLDSRPYHILVQTLVQCCLEKSAYPVDTNMTVDEQLEMHPQRIPEYQSMMFKKFTQLHSIKDVTIPSPAVWKLCIHFGATHKFNQDLAELFETLTKYHFKVFTQLQAICVYNLYKRQPPMRADAIFSIIKAHKKFIDNLPSTLLPALINANLVLQLLQMLQQSLQKLPPNTSGDRLKALKHLTHFTDNLNVNSDNILNDILTEANALKNHMLNNAEHASLNTYLSALRKYTTKDTSKST